MGVNLPSDNRLTDSNGNILPQWRAVFERLGQSIDTVRGAIQPGQDFSQTIVGGTANATLGDIPLYRNGWSTLPVGDVGSALVVGSAGLPSWGDVQAGETLLASGDLSGASAIIGPVPRTHRNISLRIRGMGNTASNDFTAQFGSDSSVSSPSFVRWAGSRITGPSVGIAGRGNVSTNILFADASVGMKVSTIFSFTDVLSGDGVVRGNYDTISYHPTDTVYNNFTHIGNFALLANTLDYIKLTAVAGTFDGGTYQLWGRN